MHDLSFPIPSLSLFLTRFVRLGGWHPLRGTAQTNATEHLNARSRHIGMVEHIEEHRALLSAWRTFLKRVPVGRPAGMSPGTGFEGPPLLYVSRTLLYSASSSAKTHSPLLSKGTLNTDIKRQQQETFWTKWSSNRYSEVLTLKAQAVKQGKEDGNGDRGVSKEDVGSVKRPQKRPWAIRHCDLFSREMEQAAADIYSLGPSTSLWSMLGGLKLVSERTLVIWYRGRSDENKEAGQQHSERPVRTMDASAAGDDSWTASLSSDPLVLRDGALPRANLDQGWTRENKDLEQHGRPERIRQLFPRPQDDEVKKQTWDGMTWRAGQAPNLR
ncbi:hypothetical protein C8J56DRAFT_1112479 [Mycena floridula]|nr:hypothetical protein C8J56DRAFT_1112479 [Mycena floridula]